MEENLFVIQVWESCEHTFQPERKRKAWSGREKLMKEGENAIDSFGRNAIDSFGRAAFEFTEGGIGLEKKPH